MSEELRSLFLPLSISRPDLQMLRQTIHATFDELNFRQLAIFAQLTPTRRLELMFEMCAFAQQMLIASEQQRHPEASEEELAKYVRARIELGYGT